MTLPAAFTRTYWFARWCWFTRKSWPWLASASLASASLASASLVLASGGCVVAVDGPPEDLSEGVVDLESDPLEVGDGTSGGGNEGHAAGRAADELSEQEASDYRDEDDGQDPEPDPWHGGQSKSSGGSSEPGKGD